MRTTAEKAGRRIGYAAAGIILMMCLLLIDKNMLVSYAADITLKTNAKVRSEASTESGVVGNVTSGTTLSVLGEVAGADGQTWYQVSVNGATGYIRADLANKNEGGGESQTETAATVSETGARSATAKTNANARKGPSASDAIVGNVKSGGSVTVTGETIGSDSNTWYQVEIDGVTGYIRADLLDVDESVGEESPEEGAEEAAPEGESPEEGEAPEEQEGGMQIGSVISSVAIPADTDLDDVTIDDAFLQENASDTHYLLRVDNEDGEKSWYLYSASDHKMEKLAIGGSGDSGDGFLSSVLEGKGKIVMIVVIVLFVILIVTCIILAVKLHEYREYGYDGGDDGYDDEDDDEEDDDDYDDEDEEEDDDDDYEDDDDDRRRVGKRRWSPKNFLARHEDDDDDYDDEDEEEDDDDDYEDDDDDYLDDDDFEFEFLNMDD